MVESDSYDFAVMDTEKDTSSANRKRKVRLVFSHSEFAVENFQFQELIS